MKKLAVLGAGESGVGTAVLAKQKGWNVWVSDKGEIKEEYKNVLTNHEINWEEGRHTLEEIFNADEVMKSPGIPEKIELIQELIQKEIPVISEIEFAARYTNAKIIGITGSNGKTTTTSLTYHILKKAGLNVGLGGNIGRSFALQVAKNNFDYFVLELSSFQLDGIVNFRPDIAIFLNITPDHLDRYEYNFQNYINSKFRITQNQTSEDYFIYCADDENIEKELLKKNINANKIPFSIERPLDEGGYITNNENITINLNDPLTMSIYELSLKGKHNLYNSMASSIASRIFDIRKDLIRESLSDFQNIEHRLESVARVHGIHFINDSKATNVNSTWYALESVDKPVVWIAGGVDKGNDYEMLKPMVEEKVKAIICLGKDNQKIHDAFKGMIDVIVDAESASQAVALSYQIANKGETVLLSPACASFDLFENYEERGHLFKKAVKAL